MGVKIYITGNNTIENSAIGENNMVICGGEDRIDWERLQKEWLALLKNLPVASEEYDKSSKALQCILNRNKGGLLDVLKTFAVSFSSGLFASAASPFLTDFIRRYI